MTEVAWLSGDFKQLTPEKAVMGGVCYARMAIPSHGIAKYGHGYTSNLGFHMVQNPDGHITTFDTMLNPHEPDVIIFHRWMAAGAGDFVRRARATGQKIISDLDDLLWKLPKRNPGYNTLDPRNDPNFNVEHHKDMLRAVDAVFTSTDHLASEVRPLNDHVVVCRNALDITAWPIQDPGRNLVVGWVGAVSWRGADLPILKPVLPDFLQDHGITFYHGGRKEAAGRAEAWEEIGIDPRKVAVTWEPICLVSDYVKLWRWLTVSLIPIERGRFGDSKSWQKGLESCASGLPFIASDHPEYRLLGAGRLARAGKPQEWLDHLEALLDPAVRRAEGAANRVRAEELDISQMWYQWDDAIRDVIAA